MSNAAKATEILPPLILHDGSYEATQLVEVMLALVPWTEVIDASTKQGRKRIRVIDAGLKDGSLDTHGPPIAIGVDLDVIFAGMKGKAP